MKRRAGKHIAEAALVLVFSVLFCVPFYFVLVNSFKTQKDAALMDISWPKAFSIIENYREVIQSDDGLVLRAFFNSSLLTVLSILLMILVCSMAGFVVQRRSGRAKAFINFILLAGLTVPPAVLPTIWVLMRTGLFKTLPGLVLVEVALGIPFTVILYRGFMATIPREIDESAFVDGCTGPKMFFSIIFPLLKPVTSTVVVISSISIFNDFVNPLYFLPGSKNVTVQLTLYNFLSIYQTKWNLLFADVILITIPPFLLFLFFNKKIVSGMTAGAVKG